MKLCYDKSGFQSDTLEDPMALPRINFIV